MNYLKRYTLIIVSILFSACDDTEDVEVQDARIVVEGFLYAGEPIEVDFSKELLFKGEVEVDISDLENMEVNVSNGNQIFRLTDHGSGSYSHEHIVSHSVIYSINFVYKGTEIIAETPIPEKPEGFNTSISSIMVEPFTGGGPPTGRNGESITLNWENPDNAYYLVVVTNLDANPESINSSGFQRQSFRSEPLITDTYDILSSEFEYYGDHSIILYKLNPEYAALYEDSGDNTLTIATPYTNVQNGLGIFTGVNSDTLYVNVYN